MARPHHRRGHAPRRPHRQRARLLARARRRAEPRALRRHARRPSHPATAALEAASTAAPGPITSLRAPDPVWPTWVAYSRVGEGPGAPLWTTRVDPATGAVLGTRKITRAFVPTLYSLHYTLLLRPCWGMELVGALGVMLLVSTVSGVCL